MSPRRGASTSTRRAEFRNEIKTRLRDRAYEALQLYKRVNGIESDSAAVARLVDVAMFGLVGTLPAEISGVPDEAGRFAPRLTA